MKKLAILSIYLCLMIPSFVCGADWEKGRYWYVVDNIRIENDTAPEILLWVALPMNHKGQAVKIEGISPEPIEIIHDTVNGNEIVFWRETDFQNREMLTFYYDFQVLTERVETNVEPQKIVPYDTTSKAYKRYIESEPWIEITPEIREKAIEIIGDEENSYFQARKIFSWLIENMSYEYPDIEHRGTRYSFNSLKGDCGEFVYVFSALCRAIGIPARAVTCVWFEAAGHAWGEILLPPYGWIPVDPSVAQAFTPAGSKAFATDEAVTRFMQSRGIPVRDPYYLFGNLYPKRVIVFIGNNAEIVSEKTNVSRTFRFMQPGGAFAYPRAIEIKGLWDKTVHTGFYVFGEQRGDKEFALQKAAKELAPSYLSVGLYDKAEDGFLQKIEEKQDDAMAWLNLGEVYMNKKEYDNALQAFDKCLSGRAGSIKPVLDVWAHNLKGNIYDLKGMREQALVEYQKVIDTNINFQGAIDSAMKYIKEPYEE